jgi:transposase-like protein
MLEAGQFPLFDTCSDNYQRPKRSQVMERVERKAKHNRIGAPTKYNAELMPQFAKFMCQRGATMAELAQAFNIANCTLYDWINRYPELHEAIQVGVDVFNPRVERALAERAIGFFVTLREEVKDAKTGEIKFPAVRRYYPPDTTAAIFFLKNRLPDRWRDVQDHNINQRTFKSSEELTIEIRKDILELQDQGYLKDVEVPALPAPKKKPNGR